MEWTTNMHYINIRKKSAVPLLSFVSKCNVGWSLISIHVFVFVFIKVVFLGLYKSVQDF
jgi:hypothetical protein